MLKNFSWAHGVALALGLFIAFILYLIFIFANGQQNSELVSDSYYQDELSYQEVIDGKNNAGQLPALPRYSEIPAGIKIDFPDSINVDQQKINFELFRTDDANLDVTKEITLDAAHSFIIPKQVISAGPYTLKLKWKHNKKPYQVDYDVLWK